LLIVLFVLHEAIAIPMAFKIIILHAQTDGLLLKECKGTSNRGDVPRKRGPILQGTFVID
jgi:hypothetical protein